MDNLYDRMTEDSLAELAKAGCTVDVKIFGHGTEATFNVEIKKDDATYGQGLRIRVDGKGTDGAAALRGAVSTAETFLHAVPPKPRPVLPNFDLPEPKVPLTVPVVAEIRDTDTRRAANMDLAEQHDDKARELVAGDEEIAF